MVRSTPASLKALSKYGRSSLSHRGEVALSGSKTQISLSHAPPDADVPVAAPVDVSLSPPQPAAMPASARTTTSTNTCSRFPPPSVLADSNFLTVLLLALKRSSARRLTAQRYGGGSGNSSREPGPEPRRLGNRPVEAQERRAEPAFRPEPRGQEVRYAPVGDHRCIAFLRSRREDRVRERNPDAGAAAPGQGRGEGKVRGSLRLHETVVVHRATGRRE